jgi:AmpD protein
MSLRVRERRQLRSDGWLPGARRIESPNQDERPEGEAVSLIVVHAISLPPGEFGGDGIIRCSAIA